jgi:hypothetical protein
MKYFLDMNIFSQGRLKYTSAEKRKQNRSHENKRSRVERKWVSHTKVKTTVVNFINILYVHLRQYSFAKRSSNLKCKYKKLSYEKAARKMLVKLTLGGADGRAKRFICIEESFCSIDRLNGNH